VKKQREYEKAVRETVVRARVQQGLPLVRRVAGKMAAKHRIDEREATALGNLGLVQAARSFQGSGGLPFLAWASIRVRGAILDGLRSGGAAPMLVCHHRGGAAARSGRVARYVAGMATARDLGMVTPRGGLAHALHTPSPEDALARADERLLLDRALWRLAPVERAFIERVYFGGETLTEASRAVGCSKSWGSRLHARALRQLRRFMTRASGEYVLRLGVHRLPTSRSSGPCVARNRAENAASRSWRVAC